VVDLPPAGGLEVEYAEVAVALEVARDKDNDVKPAATLLRRQTDEKAGRSVLHKAPSAVA